jgi:hypothetical protein
MFRFSHLEPNFLDSSMATLSRSPLSGSKKAQITHTASEWTLASDDAWDSASDSETTYRSPSSSRLGHGLGVSASKPIPVSPFKSKSDEKSPKSGGIPVTGNSGESIVEGGSFAFSYTHVNTPSASSSYTRQSTVGKPAGWTMVTKPRPSRVESERESVETALDPEVENELEVDVEGSVTEIGIGRNRRIQEGKEAIKYDVEDIVNGICIYVGIIPSKCVPDPLHAVHSLSTTEYEERVASGIGHPERQHQHAMRAQKRQKFVDCLTADNVDITELRKLAWSGIPEELRPISWMLLLVSHIPY